MSSVEIKVMDFPDVKRFCDQTERAITELTARVTKAEHERDAQHALVLKLTAERDEVRARAEASFDALAKGARDVPCSGPCSESARCGACLAHANQAGLGRMLERTQNQRDAWAARFASLRARVEGLPWARRGSGADITGAVEKNDVLALLDKEPA